MAKDEDANGHAAIEVVPINESNAVVAALLFAGERPSSPTLQHETSSGSL